MTTQKSVGSISPASTHAPVQNSLCQKGSPQRNVTSQGKENRGTPASLTTKDVHSLCTKDAHSLCQHWIQLMELPAYPTIVSSPGLELSLWWDLSPGAPTAAVPHSLVLGIHSTSASSELEMQWLCALLSVSQHETLMCHHQGLASSIVLGLAPGPRVGTLTYYLQDVLLLHPIPWAQAITALCHPRAHAANSPLSTWAWVTAAGLRSKSQCHGRSTHTCTSDTNATATASAPVHRTQAPW